MIVIDTHIWVWLALSPDRISPAAVDAISQSAKIGVSSISMWEVAVLSRKKRLDLEAPVQQWIEKYFKLDRYRLLHLTPEIAANSEALDMHGDPADRIITATAIAQNCPLVTADGLIQKSGLVQTIW